MAKKPKQQTQPATTAAPATKPATTAVPPKAPSATLNWISTVNPHRVTSANAGAGVRHAAFAHAVTCSNSAQYLAGGAYCKPKYLQRWAAKGLLKLG